MVDLQAAYARTAAGLAEIKGRELHLTREQRNLLIVIDGKSALATFAHIVGCTPEHMEQVATPLIRNGLIALAGDAPVAGRTQPAEVGLTLIALAGQVFGSHAGPIVRKLEKAGASPAEQLAAAEGAAKLAKLTINEHQADVFLAEARKLIGL